MHQGFSVGNIASSEDIDGLKNGPISQISHLIAGSIFDPLSDSDKTDYSPREILDLSFVWARMFRGLCADRNTPVLIPMRISIQSVCALFGALEAGLFPILIKPSTPTNLMMGTLEHALGGYVLAPSRLKESLLARGLVDCDAAYQGYVVLRSSGVVEPHQHPHSILGILSSGSTGKPKVIVQPFSNVLKNARMHIESVGVRSDDSVALNLPLYYSYGLVAGLFGTLLSGANGVLADTHRLNSQKLFDASRITVGMTTPGSARVTFGTDVLRSIRLLTVGGDVLHFRQALQLMSDVHNGQVIATYGLSEAGPRVATSHLTEELIMHHKATPLGKALKQVSLRLDFDQSDNQCGELLISTPTAMLEYLNDPILTGQAFTEDRSAILSGDVYREIEGDFFFLGRRKRLIIRAGENLYPASIEAQILHHCDVEDVWVTGQDSDGLGQVAKAFVISERRLDFTQVSRKLRQHMPTSQIPSEWQQVDSLPPQARK